MSSKTNRQMAASATEAPKWKLNNGLEIPALALGTYLGFDEVRL